MPYMNYSFIWFFALNNSWYIILVFLILYQIKLIKKKGYKRESTKDRKMEREERKKKWVEEIVDGDKKGKMKEALPTPE